MLEDDGCRQRGRPVRNVSVQYRKVTAAGENYCKLEGSKLIAEM
jgi:hypothetical protein